VIIFELDRSARENPGSDIDSIQDNAGDEPMSLAELQVSAKRVLGADVPLRSAPDMPLDLRRFSGINSRIASHYRVGRVILVGDAALQNERKLIARLASALQVPIDAEAPGRQQARAARTRWDRQRAGRPVSLAHGGG
jgi:hypothetical protein